MTDAPVTNEEQQYLKGLWWSDEDYRLNKRSDPERIDQYGPGSQAFWRGFWEGGGYIGMYSSNRYPYPRVRIKATRAILSKFLDFMQQEACTKRGLTWRWDADGKLQFQADGGFFHTNGTKAQEVVRALYVGGTVGRASSRRMADAIVVWTGRR